MSIATKLQTIYTAVKRVKDWVKQWIGAETIDLETAVSTLESWKYPNNIREMFLYKEQNRDRIVLNLGYFSFFKYSAIDLDTAMDMIKDYFSDIANGYEDNYIYAYAANMNLNQYQANADWNRIGFKVRVVNGTAGIVNGTYSINMSNIDFTEVNNTATLTFTLSSLCYYIYLMPSYVDSNGETRGLSSLILSGNINVLSDESLLSIVRAFKDNTEEKTLKVQYSVLRQRFIDSEEVQAVCTARNITITA
jgi:hypothetical protein